MTGINWLEMFGYAASIITGISLTMSSIIRLRWMNLTGAFCFGTYGVMIGAPPVAVLNYFICCANIFYLWKIYTEKTHFRMLAASVNDVYIREFLKLHQEEIRTFFPTFRILRDSSYTAMMIHRNLSLAGVFIGRKIDSRTMEVTLDYVLPEYRDLKPGEFIFRDNIDFFRDQGIKRLVSDAGNDIHAQYLQRVGFKLRGGQHELLLH
ncbi:hypothetical protein [Spongorhabdus nitratireducens]